MPLIPVPKSQKRGTSVSLRITWSAQWLQDSWDYITRPYLKTNEVIIVDPFLQNGDSYVTCFSSLSSTDRTYILFFVGFSRENLTVQPRLSWNLWSSGFCLQNIDITNMDYHTRPREKFIVIREYILKNRLLFWNRASRIPGSGCLQTLLCRQGWLWTAGLPAAASQAWRWQACAIKFSLYGARFGPQDFMHV